jgi:hypothetical protein
MNRLHRLKDINPFAVVEAAITLASLVLVGLVVGRQLGPMTGLTAEWAPLITWPVALIFDVLWIGALRMAADAIRQRNGVATAVLGTVAVAAVAASTLILWRMGHMSVFSLMPAGTLAFMGLRLYTENTLADGETREVIAAASLRVRNDRALAASAARDMAADAETEVMTDTAVHLAALRRDEAMAKTYTKADISMTRTRARMAGRLDKAHAKHGEAAARYAELRAAHRPVAIEPPPAPWADAPVAEIATQVSELDEAFADALELVGGGELTVADIASSLDLAGVCAIHEVPVPQPGESLEDGQVTAILTWLRYSQTPPASFRQALKAFRAAGYKATDKTLQTLWRALEAPAETAATD